MTAATIATQQTADLNGMLTATPSLISVNVIAQQLQSEPQMVLEFCQAHGVFTAPIYNGGEYMVDFNSINESFVRDFKVFTLSKSLEPAIQESVAAIASLRNNTAAAVCTPTDTAPTETTTSGRTWKLAQKGKNMRETVINLIAKNDPSGTKGFIESLRSRDESATALIQKISEKTYEGKKGVTTRLWNAVDAYLTELNTSGGGDTGNTEEKPARAPRTNAPRRKKTAA